MAAYSRQHNYGSLVLYSIFSHFYQRAAASNPEALPEIIDDLIYVGQSTCRNLEELWYQVKRHTCTFHPTYKPSHFLHLLVPLFSPYNHLCVTVASIGSAGQDYLASCHAQLDPTVEPLMEPHEPNPVKALAIFVERCSEVQPAVAVAVERWEVARHLLQHELKVSLELPWSWEWVRYAASLDCETSKRSALLEDIPLIAKDA
jgi:hypothetical protein